MWNLSMIQVHASRPGDHFRLLGPADCLVFRQRFPIRMFDLLA
jgi:hypothetical protein